MTGISAYLPPLGGLMMIAALAVSILHEFTGETSLAVAAGLFTGIGMGAFWPGLAWSRRVFVLIGLVLLAWLALTREDWTPAALAAIQRAGFIAAFFTAMTTMRAAATGSAAIIACGRYLAGQPPGRRYLALTLGGHLFGLILLYGAIALLGSLATEAADREPDPKIRRHRTRRMLVAIQRGFISTLAWSPLTFASAITLTLVPGASWAGAAPYCVVSALLLAGIGWILDSIFKPRLATPPPRSKPDGPWLTRLRPLLVLLAVLLAAVGVVHLLTGMRVFGAVMTVVPVIAMVWVAFQPGSGSGIGRVGRRTGDFILRDLPGQSPEFVLLIMAAFIGALGGELAAPLVAGGALDLARVPAPVLLTALFWVIVLTGQLGMNPLLSVALLAPLLPAPPELGVAPAVVVVTLTGGWALSGATSPVTASTLLVGAFGRVGARRVGLGWNGLYGLVCGMALSLWIVALSMFIR